ncbi:purine-nucleoside phosphorylase [Fulvimarina sp. MAC8]|uniref:purine-nucleoside phosphorylase n=1 Tax=Fulvimarina sp. MAC8 TaxID=3162874 RepID=UPI0032F07C3E
MVTATLTIRGRTDLVPKIGLVLGSGLGSLVDLIEEPVTIGYQELDGFPVSTVSGHQGSLVLGRLSGVPVAAMSGRSHYYEHGKADVMRRPLETLAELGVEILILTNSAGSLIQEAGPGAVMMIEDHINLSGTNPLIGEPTDRRFVGMTTAYDASIRESARAIAAELEFDLHAGVYAWFSGPSFETPAEIRMARTLGADAVGMSTVPEVILARFLGLRVAAFSVITNMGAGITGAELSHEETKAMAPKGGADLARLLAALIGRLATSDKGL